MNKYLAYYTIIQKVIGIKNPIQIENPNHVENKLPKEKLLQFLENILTKEWNQRNMEIDKQICILFLFMINTLYIHPKDFYYKKYGFIENIQSNPFLTTSMKELFMGYFSKIQQHYFALVRFIHIVKMKKAKLQNDSDLLLNIIDTKKPKDYLIVYHCNAKYMFSTRDMLRMLINSITRSYNFCIDIYAIKNPYNNIKFTTANLYNIYFALKNSEYLIHPLIDRYFLCEFDLDVLELNYEDEIMSQIVFNIAYKSSSRTIRGDIIDMLKRYAKKLVVDKSFPDDVLAEAMRPFLHLYYVSNYSRYNRKRLDFSNELKKKMDKFAKQNVHFGRKIFSMKTKNFSYNTEYIPYGRL